MEQVNLLFTFARGYNLLLFVHVIFMTFNVAATALQSRRRFKHMPQWLHTSLTVGWEMIESRNEFMSLVANIIGFFSNWLHWKFLFLLTFSFIGIQNLQIPKRTMNDFYTLFLCSNNFYT